MRATLLIILSLGLFISCDKPNPEPEKMDPIYEDLLKEAAKAGSELKSAEKDLEGFEKELSEVAPQTGQIKYAQKRVYDTQRRIDLLKQTQLYWTTRAESRKKWARSRYMAAYKEKKPWPEPAEWEEYKIQRKLEVAPKNWNNKQRMEQAQLGISLKSEKPAEKEH